MNICPCCSSILLRHLNAQKVTWFCSQCRQEMPIINLNKQHLHKHHPKFANSNFQIDWDKQVATCPRGHQSKN